MSTPLRYQYLDSPAGELRLVSDGVALIRIEFPNHRGDDGEPGEDAVLAASARQLREYFAGTRRRFTLPLAPRGTEFQRSVWSALATIPFGETRSYRDIAEQIGNPKAMRAVGAANGRNPLPIVVPCHRVVGADGSLTGFGGGLPAKLALLQLEGIALTASARRT
jgi:methylated-DNA-[protein]-cysteine S-methyltransferase